MHFNTAGLIEGEEFQTRIPEGLHFGMFDVHPEKPTWKYIQQRLQESMPDAELLTVQRVFNRRLWGPFVTSRSVVASGNKGDAASKLLFHGGSTDCLAKIIGATIDAGSNASGFSTNRSRHGSYSAPGCASYFAHHAIYPVRIHPQKRDEQGFYILIMAEVLCGAIFDFGRDKKPGLLAAPAKPEGGTYDSVMGTEESISKRRIPGGREEFGSQIVIFKDDRAYPHFVIRIRRGTRIQNSVSRRFLYAKQGHNWTKEVGAGWRDCSDGGVGADGDWILKPTGEKTVFRIVNAYSGRCLYAKVGCNWKQEIGAGYPESAVGKDGNWRLSQNRDGTWRIINVTSGRCLYAKSDNNWLCGWGAGKPSQKVGDDGNWRLTNPPKTS